MKLDLPAVVLEKEDGVGGLSRTVSYKGYRFDIGGHRFFTKIGEVSSIWHEILGSDFLLRPRLSRILYNGTFFTYPLKPANALLGLGPIEAARILLSYVGAQLFPAAQERSFEEWVSNRFGRRLFEIFFKTYTEKVWGLPCDQISADWAEQRIRNLDLVTAIKNALVSSGTRRGEIVTTLIDQFHYPRLGPGMLWERCRDLLAEKGYRTITGATITRVRHDGTSVLDLTARDRSGREWLEGGTRFLSSMPIRDLVDAFSPAAPPDVLEAANRLRYRDFLTVVLIVDRPELFPDNWIYIHSPDVRVGRIQNYKNWSPAMVPDPTTTSLGLEYFVQQNGELWNSTDEELLELGQRECRELGLIDSANVIDGAVVRTPKAYPVYDSGYQEALARIRSYLGTFRNLELMGRNGQHRYNNQDHSMVTAIYAVRNICGSSYDVWNVNVEKDYHEDVRESDEVSADRAVPRSIAREADEELIRSVFARYDPVALGGALAIVLGAGIFLTTALLLLRGGDTLGPDLSLLGNYLLGFGVSPGGVLLGSAEAALGGFVFGYVLGRMINAVVGWREKLSRHQIELESSLDSLDVGEP